MKISKHKILGLISLIIICLCSAITCGATPWLCVALGAVEIVICVGFWFLASGFTADPEGKNWAVYMPFAVLCILGSLLFGGGIQHIFFAVATLTFCLDGVIVFSRKEARPAFHSLRFYCVCFLACLLFTGVEFIVTGGILL